MLDWSYLILWVSLVAVATTTPATSRKIGGSLERGSRGACSKFIYIYPLPDKFNVDVARMQLDREEHKFTLWYDTDQALHQSVKDCATNDPTAADLFHIPIYTGQYYHSLLKTSGLNHQDSVHQMAALMKEGLDLVKQTWPFWNQTNGLDHFVGAPLDAGRCHSMAGLTKEDFGDLFTVQFCGDRFLKDFESETWHCYRPGRDVVIPVGFDVKLTVLDVVSPDYQPRNVSILYRFVEGGRGEYGKLRTTLLQSAKQHHIPGMIEGWATLHQTHADMKNSLFCVCPPGVSQAILRMARSIVFGCIPVTFFRGHDQPYQHFLGLDYSRFSINISPDESHLLHPMITRLLNDRQRLISLQTELKKVQSLFVDDSETGGGVHQAVLESLKVHPSRAIRLAQ